MPKLIKIMVIFLLIVIVSLAVVLCYFFVGYAKVSKDITWGVDFSQMQAENLKLDWKKTYTDMIDDLGVKNIKLHTQWDWIEGTKGDYYFGDTDWQVKQAEDKNVNIIYVVGMKTGRWPECHIPSWAQNLSEEQQKSEVLKYTKAVVERYKNSKAIINWQVENEPLLNFGECPSWYYKNDSFLREEVSLVKSLDSSRKVIVSDSGELSWWINASKVGDILGTTMYRKAWVKVDNNFGLFGSYPGFYGSYPIPPVYYSRKASLIKFLFDKKVICVELQAEPWPLGSIYNVSVQEQEKTMDLNQFKTNVEYAKKTGLDTFYFWGVEWWQWMKEKQGRPEIWNEAKKIFIN